MRKFLSLPFLVFTICSCSTQELLILDESLDYDFISDAQIQWSEIFKQTEDRYLVYFYSPTCGYCEDIKNDILGYFKNNDVCMYFVSDKENFIINNDIDETIGCNDIDLFFIIGTPSLVEVYHHEISMNIGGVSKIYEFLFQID